MRTNGHDAANSRFSQFCKCIWEANTQPQWIPTVNRSLRKAKYTKFTLMFPYNVTQENFWTVQPRTWTALPIYSRHWQKLQDSILTCYYMTCWAANIPASYMGGPRLIYWPGNRLPWLGCYTVSQADQDHTNFKRGSTLTSIPNIV